MTMMLYVIKHYQPQPKNNNLLYPWNGIFRKTGSYSSHFDI